MNESFTGTLALTRLIVRRDRVLFAVWIVIAATIPLSLASAFHKLYPTPGALSAFAAECMSNPVIVAILGPIYAPSVGGLTAWRASAAGMLAMGLASLLFVVRHLRTDEEAGRRELIGASVVGRNAPLAAAMSATLIGNLIVAAIIAGGLAAQGLPVPGSIALSLSWAAAGWIFAGVGALASELCASASTARNIGFVVFAFFFAERVAGDSGGANGSLAWISWLSPLGWTRLSRPFVSERWWIFAMVAVVTAALALAAFAIASKRDLGAGVIAPRAGRADAAPSLKSPLGLAWRLHRGALVGWVAGLAIGGLLFGAVARNLIDVTSSPQTTAWLARIGVHDPASAFLRIVVYIFSQIVSAYAILAALRMRAEEAELRAEPILAAPVGRIRWAASHLLFALGGPAVALLFAGVTAGLAYGLNDGDLSRELPRMTAMMLTMIPAVWVMAAIAIAAYGAAPRYATAASWLIFALFLVLELGWEMRLVSSLVFAVSPFAHVHWTSEVHASSILLLLVVAAMLTTAGLAALSRRDIA
jgi:ABC-2 type transport system permease protein